MRLLLSQTEKQEGRCRDYAQPPSTLLQEPATAATSQSGLMSKDDIQAITAHFGVRAERPSFETTLILGKAITWGIRIQCPSLIWPQLSPQLAPQLTPDLPPEHPPSTP